MMFGDRHLFQKKVASPRCFVRRWQRQKCPHLYPLPEGEEVSPFTRRLFVVFPAAACLLFP